MEVGVSAQCFQGAAASIHLRTICSALANELSPLGLSGTLRKNSENRHRKLWEREVEKKIGEGRMELGSRSILYARKRKRNQKRSGSEHNSVI